MEVSSLSLAWNVKDMEGRHEKEALSLFIMHDYDCFYAISVPE